MISRSTLRSMGNRMLEDLLEEVAAETDAAVEEGALARSAGVPPEDPVDDQEGRLAELAGVEIETEIHRAGEEAPELLGEADADAPATAGVGRLDAEIVHVLAQRAPENEHGRPGALDLGRDPGHDEAGVDAVRDADAVVHRGDRERGPAGPAVVADAGTGVAAGKRADDEHAVGEAEDGRSAPDGREGLELLDGAVVVAGLRRALGFERQAEAVTEIGGVARPPVETFRRRRSASERGGRPRPRGPIGYEVGF